MPSPQPVQTDAAPAPISLFSQAQVYNGLVYCSGNIGIDPKTGKLIEGTVAERTVSKPLSQQGRSFNTDTAFTGTNYP